MNVVFVLKPCRDILGLILLDVNEISPLVLQNDRCAMDAQIVSSLVRNNMMCSAVPRRAKEDLRQDEERSKRLCSKFVTDSEVQ